MRFHWDFVVLILLAFLVVEYQSGVIDEDLKLPDIEGVSRKTDNVIRQVDNAIGSLKSIKARAIQHHRKINIAKTVGTTAGTLGTIGTVAGIALACFTGGTSLILTVSSAVASVVGGITSITASSIDEAKTKEYNQDAANILKITHASFQDLQEEIFFAVAMVDVIKRALEKSVDKSMASNIGKTVFRDGYKIPFSLYRNLNAINFFRTLDLTNLLTRGVIPTRTNLPTTGGLYTKTELQTIDGLFKSKETFKAEAKLIKSNIKSALVGGAMKGALAAFGLAMSVWEVVELVSSWRSDHPTVKEVDKAITDLNLLRGQLYNNKLRLNQECK